MLGIDVGWSQKRPTTGFCLIEWRNRRVHLECCQAGTDEDDRRSKLRQLVGKRQLLAVAIDGSLVPGLGITAQYRPVEALLSRGKFQRRGKPGPTSSGSGQRLHQEATKLARLVTSNQDLAPAAFPCRVSQKAIVEAFPNAFLAFLHPDEGFPRQPQQSRRWTDTLFPRVSQRLPQLLEILLPKYQLDFNIKQVKGHDTVASFICAITALCVVLARCVIIGDPHLGYIALPPLELWGQSLSGDSRWALDALRDNWAAVRHQFPEISIYRDNNPEPALL